MILVNLIDKFLINRRRNKLKLNIVFLLEKQIYMNTFLNKWVKNLSNWKTGDKKCFSGGEKVSEAGG